MITKVGYEQLVETAGFLQNIEDSELTKEAGIPDNLRDIIDQVLIALKLKERPGFIRRNLGKILGFGLPGLYNYGGGLALKNLDKAKSLELVSHVVEPIMSLPDNATKLDATLNIANTARRAALLPGRAMKALAVQKLGL